MERMLANVVLAIGKNGPSNGEKFSFSRADVVLELSRPISEDCQLLKK
jgi:hypothetical protein